MSHTIPTTYLPDSKTSSCVTCECHSAHTAITERTGCRCDCRAPMIVIPTTIDTGHEAIILPCATAASAAQSHQGAAHITPASHAHLTSDRRQEVLQSPSQHVLSLNAGMATPYQCCERKAACTIDKRNRVSDMSNQLPMDCRNGDGPPCPKRRRAA